MAAAHGAHAASACHVNALGETPAGCAAVSSWVGNGQYEPAIVTVQDGGGYYKPAGGLAITNGNTPAPGAANSGTRGIYATGQSFGTSSVVDITGAVDINVAATNVFNPASNEGVSANLGAQMRFRNDLRVVTATNPSIPTLQAAALVAHGLGTGLLASTGSTIVIDGSLQADTSAAAKTAVAVQATDGGRISVGAGGLIKSAQAGLYVRVPSSPNAPTTFDSTGPQALTVQAQTGVVMEGQSAGTANAGAVNLERAVIQATEAGVLMYSGGSASSSLFLGLGGGSSITSTNGSALAFTGGIGKVDVSLAGATVSATSTTPGGADSNGAPMGYAIASTSPADIQVSANNSTINGPIVHDAPGAKLWLMGADAVWNAGGDPAAANINSLTGISGTLTIRLPDLRDQIWLEGNAPSLGAGCGNAQVSLVIDPAQPAPAASPQRVMWCKNAASAPTVSLPGGRVVLGGFIYTLQTVAADGRVNYNLVRGAAAPGGPGTPGGATSVPTLSEWGLMVLAGLLGLMGWKSPAWGRRR